MTVLAEKQEAGFSSGPPRKKVRVSEGEEENCPKEDSAHASSEESKTDSFHRPFLIPRKKSLSLSIKQKSLTSYMAAPHENGTQILFPQNRLPLRETMNGYLTGSETEAKSSTDESPGSEAASSDRASPVATLCNLGNTCFLNSVLYTLRFAPYFLHNLHHLVSDLSDLNKQMHNQTNSSNKTREGSSALNNHSGSEIEKSKIQVTTEKLHELYQSLHTSEHKEINDPFQPDVFLHALR